MQSHPRTSSKSGHRAAVGGPVLPVMETTDGDPAGLRLSRDDLVVDARYQPGRDRDEQVEDLAHQSVLHLPELHRT